MFSVKLGGGGHGIFWQHQRAIRESCLRKNLSLRKVFSCESFSLHGIRFLLPSPPPFSSSPPPFPPFLSFSPLLLIVLLLNFLRFSPPPHYDPRQLPMLGWLLRGRAHLNPGEFRNRNHKQVFINAFVLLDLLQPLVFENSQVGMDSSSTSCPDLNPLSLIPRPHSSQSHSQTSLLSVSFPVKW